MVDINNEKLKQAKQARANVIKKGMEFLGNVLSNSDHSLQHFHERLHQSTVCEAPGVKTGSGNHSLYPGARSDKHCLDYRYTEVDIIVSASLAKPSAKQAMQLALPIHEGTVQIVEAIIRHDTLAAQKEEYSRLRKAASQSVDDRKANQAYWNFMDNGGFQPENFESFEPKNRADLIREMASDIMAAKGNKVSDKMYKLAFAKEIKKLSGVTVLVAGKAAEINNQIKESIRGYLTGMEATDEVAMAKEMKAIEESEDKVLTKAMRPSGIIMMEFRALVKKAEEEGLTDPDKVEQVRAAKIEAQVQGTIKQLWAPVSAVA